MRMVNQEEKVERMIDQRVQYMKKYDVVGWFNEILTLDLERRVRYATSPPEDLSEKQRKELSDILTDSAIEAKGIDQLKLMEDIEKYCNQNDVEAWLTVLKLFDIDKKA